MNPALPLISRCEQGSCLFPPISGPPVMAPCHASLPGSGLPSGPVGPQSSVGHLSPAQAVLHQESACGTLWPVSELLVSLSPASTHTCSRSPLVPRAGGLAPATTNPAVLGTATTKYVADRWKVAAGQGSVWGQKLWRWDLPGPLDLFILCRKVLAGLVARRILEQLFSRFLRAWGRGGLRRPLEELQPLRPDSYQEAWYTRLRTLNSASRNRETSPPGDFPAGTWPPHPTSQGGHSHRRAWQSW